MSNEHLEEQQEAVIKDQITQTILRWVRVLLPLILGALGYYAGNIIGPLEDRITKNEERSLANSTYISKDIAEVENLEKRIIALEEQCAAHTTTTLQLSRFIDFKREVQHDIKDLEKDVKDLLKWAHDRQ